MHLKLPKNALSHPQSAAMLECFGLGVASLRQGGQLMASRWPLDDRLCKALQLVAASNQLQQGLEQIEKLLDREGKGLKLLEQKVNQTTSERLSRLLLLSNDGSDRFYHDVESMVSRHQHRTWVCLIEATGDDLGKLLTAKGTPVKAILIKDREALEAFLVAMVTR